MHRTIIIRREYLHFIPKYSRYEKRHKNVAAHVSPAFRVMEGDQVTVGQCRPLSKTVRWRILPVCEGGKRMLTCPRSDSTSCACCPELARLLRSSASSKLELFWHCFWRDKHQGGWEVSSDGSGTGCCVANGCAIDAIANKKDSRRQLSVWGSWFTFGRDMARKRVVMISRLRSYL